MTGKKARLYTYSRKGNRVAGLLFAALFILITRPVSGQVTDTTYTADYPQDLRVFGYLGSSYLLLQGGKTSYTPNYPLTPGIGIAIKNTIINIRGGYGIFPLKNSQDYGRSRTLDLQLHSYWRKLIFDLSFQRYKGFYNGKKEEVITRYPDMAALQAAAAGTYVFNGKKFSTRAAFEQSEKQLRSAGSFMIGGGLYYYRLGNLSETFNSAEHSFDIFQVGVHAGYGYSWVISPHWLLSASGAIGANIGNKPNQLKELHLKVYPAASGRFAISYHSDSWALGLSSFVGSKTVTPLQTDLITITSITSQLTYVKYLNSPFVRKIVARHKRRKQVPSGTDLPEAYTNR